MHGWPRFTCDDGFYSDMINECNNANLDSRKRRHIEDFVPLLRHKFKRSLKSQEKDDSFYSMWTTVCEWAAGMYMYTRKR